MEKMVLRIGGMSCSACSSGLEKYLNKQNGIISASVNLVMASATIEYDGSILSYGSISDFISEAGFECIGEYDKTEDNDTSLSKKQFAVFSVFAVFVLFLSMGHMLGVRIPYVSSNATVFYAASFVLSVPFLYYGYDILKSGVKNAIHITPNMDSLVTLGVFSAFLYSVAVSLLFVFGKTDTPPDVYFESVAAVIYFVKLGKLIDKKSKAKTKKAISALVQITPAFAFIKTEHGEKRVSIDEITENDILACHPGEKIAADGEIVIGSAHVDEAFITGESKPSLKKPGDMVLAGSINTNGYIEIRAKKVGKNSTVSEIVRLVLESSSTKPPIARAADKICLFFVPTVAIIAILTFIIQLASGLGLSSSVHGFITVLVVACPCSLGLATPLATVISEGELAADGILIKKSEILENAQKLNTVIFDKTGTLTYGKMSIAHSFTNTDDTNELMKKACSIEQKSSHPIAYAFKDYASKNCISMQDVSDFTVLEGYGIAASYKGVPLHMVNGKYLLENNIKNPFSKEETTLSSKGESIVYFIENGHVLALFGISDVIKEDAPKEITALNDAGIETIMLTGDNEKTANHVANELGIDTVIAGVMPKDKVDTVIRLRNSGRILAMVGDGINDAAALASADISISMHGATDIAMDCADVIFTRPTINGISKLIDTSKKTMRIIKENLFLAFLYNSFMIPIAAGVLIPFGITINPMIAAFAMILSSISVSLNSLRLTRRRKQK